MRTVALVHSPFLGPGSMRPLAEELSARGHHVVVPDLRAGLSAVPCHDGLADRFDEQTPAEPLLVAGHSGAGPLLPHLAARRPGSRLLYIDAGLPTPGLSWRDTVPADLYDTLTGHATSPPNTSSSNTGAPNTGDADTESSQAAAHEALLQPWHTWFDPSPLDSAELRQAVLPEEPRVPVRFLHEPRPHADEPPSAYLRLSSPYDRALEQARARDLPVRSLDADHLAPTSTPGPVASAVETLARELE
ncbi:alpha/beta hydrolase [Prauserella rugosa]|nr:alpha/beta hydrolase [Prauserella rugosa]KMS68163.1 hypothetical protein ACZ91_67005 [Streptomyces regensis]